MSFVEVNITKNKNAGRTFWSPYYRMQRRISADKKKDMVDLLPYISPNHHQFFKNLPVEMTTRSTDIVNNEDNENYEFVYVDWNDLCWYDCTKTFQIKNLYICIKMCYNYNIMVWPVSTTKYIYHFNTLLNSNVLFHKLKFTTRVKKSIFS